MPAASLQHRRRTLVPLAPPPALPPCLQRRERVWGADREQWAARAGGRLLRRTAGPPPGAPRTHEGMKPAPLNWLAPWSKPPPPYMAAGARCGRCVQVERSSRTSGGVWTVAAAGRKRSERSAIDRDAPAGPRRPGQLPPPARRRQHEGQPMRAMRRQLVRNRAATVLASRLHTFQGLSLARLRRLHPPARLRARPARPAPPAMLVQRTWRSSAVAGAGVSATRRGTSRPPPLPPLRAAADQQPGAGMAQQQAQPPARQQQGSSSSDTYEFTYQVGWEGLAGSFPSAPPCASTRSGGVVPVHGPDCIHPALHACGWSGD